MNNFMTTNDNQIKKLVDKEKIEKGEDGVVFKDEFKSIQEFLNNTNSMYNNYL